MVQPPKPGYFKHNIMTKLKFSGMDVGNTKCGKTKAVLEEWPVNGNKFYIKLSALLYIHELNRSLSRLHFASDCCS